MLYCTNLESYLYIASLFSGASDLLIKIFQGSYGAQLSSLATLSAIKQIFTTITAVMCSDSTIISAMGNANLGAVTLKALELP